jgi:hypothetical protein
MSVRVGYLDQPLLIARHTTRLGQFEHPQPTFQGTKGQLLGAHDEIE